MNNQRRKYPRVTVAGQANILLAGVVRNGTLMKLSPSGIQIECRRQLVEQLVNSKSDSGLYPEFELEFALPSSGSNKKHKKARKTIKSTCHVSFCRRQRQDSYHLGLDFVSLHKSDEKKVTEYINHASAAAA